MWHWSSAIVNWKAIWWCTTFDRIDESLMTSQRRIGDSRYSSKSRSDSRFFSKISMISSMNYFHWGIIVARKPGRRAAESSHITTYAVRHAPSAEMHVTVEMHFTFRDIWWRIFWPLTVIATTTLSGFRSSQSDVRMSWRTMLERFMDTAHRFSENFSCPSIQPNSVSWTSPPIAAMVQSFTFRGNSSWHRCVSLTHFRRPAS
jgi:hypothetical protein